MDSYKNAPRGIISTHALTEGDQKCCFSAHIRSISTHALTEGDDMLARDTGMSPDISTHALTEGDTKSKCS